MFDLNNAPVTIHRMLALKKLVPTLSYLNKRDIYDFYKDQLVKAKLSDTQLLKIMLNHTKQHILPSLHLVHYNGKLVSIGDKVKMFDAPVIVCTWSKPTLHQSEGRVFVKSSEHPNPKLRELYPSVCDLRWERFTAF